MPWKVSCSVAVASAWTFRNLIVSNNKHSTITAIIVSAYLPKIVNIITGVTIPTHVKVSNVTLSEIFAAPKSMRLGEPMIVYINIPILNKLSTNLQPLF